MRASVDIAAPADDEAIRGLLRRQPIPGRVRLTFEREPRFSTGCEVTGANPIVLVARAGDGAIAGVACRSVRHVYINGCPERIGYLGQLRIDERFRGRWLVSRGFSLLADIDRADPVPAYLVSIVDGSDEATAILVRKRRASFPVFHQVARYQTLALPVRRRHGPSAPAATTPDEVVAGSADQLPDVVEFLRRESANRQLAPVWTADAVRDLGPLGLRCEDLRIARRDGRIAGVIGFWDQSAFKQSVVRGYSGWLRAASWLGGSVVPRVGDQVRSAYAAMIAVAGDDADVFRRLLHEMTQLAATRGFDYLVVGLDARDPLLAVARERRHLSYPSRLYLASWPQIRHSLDTASHGVPLHERLDRRPAYVDVATL